MTTNRVSRQKRAKYFNRSMLSDGILLFCLSLIALGVEERTLVLFGHDIYTVPSWSYTVLGTIAATLSILFMVATFNKWLADKIDHIIEGPFGHSYWTIFWLVYTTGWLKGLSSIPAEGCAFQIAFWVGFVWFVIITIIWLKSIYKVTRWLREFHYKGTVK